MACWSVSLPISGFLGPSDERLCHKARWTAPETWYLVLISGTYMCTNTAAQKKTYTCAPLKTYETSSSPQSITLPCRLISLCVCTIANTCIYLYYRCDLSPIDLPTVYALCMTFPQETRTCVYSTQVRHPQQTGRSTQVQLGKLMGFLLGFRAEHGASGSSITKELRVYSSMGDILQKLHHLDLTPKCFPGTSSAYGTSGRSSMVF